MTEERRRRRRPHHEFTHEPVTRFTWEQLVRRAELDPSTKFVAWAMATWASEDGGDIIVSARLLADAMERKPRMVGEHLAILRKLGLIEALTEPSPGNSVEYQLTFPGEAFARIPMRLDTKGNRITDRPVGRTGTRRPKKAVAEALDGDGESGTGAPVNNSDTGTREPVNNADGGTRAPVNNCDGGTRAPLCDAVQEHPGADDPDDTGTRAHDHRHPGADSPAPGCHQPLHDQPRPTPVVTTDSPPTSPETDSEANHDRNDEAAEIPEPPTELQYARASRYLRSLDVLDRDHALTLARKHLEADGVPLDNRRLTVLAAQQFAAFGDPRAA